ncbi:FtsX-like permease family protein [Paraglaciecola aquimarina]|uniref:FtsX-like permease family protein n=1 Tax=Paraglaciecola aquimarina TaxID=1235557 RepID=A0ABU3SUR3_9ALTE|nr:FtsX-like permease family protein [Paraglaciecola aquimarina]MDU0353739.1 FtsX-like permease family protein [Paraglaciecola aquimarina]
MLTSIAWQSLVSRRKTVLLTFLSLVVSISVLLSVEHIRLQAKESFNRTISGVDLIVGAPSGELNLLLYSVFRMGSPTNNIKYDSFAMLKSNQSVVWAVPISLGDSHHGFRVMGTNQDYFKYFKYANKKALALTAGKIFDGPFAAVIGADVAKSLGYQVGDKIVLSHGIGQTSFVHHDQAPFTVSGIIGRTGTPVDKTVHVSLAAIEAIHLPATQLQKLLQESTQNNSQLAVNNEYIPDSITAVLLGLNNKFATFTLQRQIGNYQQDRLMAVLPGVAMAQLWSLMGNVEKVLQVIGSLVLLASLFGLATMLLASMNERQKEIAVFRILGASPKLIVSLVLLEALIISVFAIMLSFLVVTLLLTALDGWLTAEYGLFLNQNVLTQDSAMLALIILGATSVTALIPGIEAYKRALHGQLSAR